MLNFRQFHRVRGMAAGLSAALDYFLSFISTKTYFDLETSLSMPGISLLNCIIAGCGIVLIYKIMPETENRTLEDIEMHFSDNSKRITDRKIAKVSSDDGEEDLKPHDEMESRGRCSIENGNEQIEFGPRKAHDNHGFEFSM